MEAALVIAALLLFLGSVAGAPPVDPPDPARCVPVCIDAPADGYAHAIRMGRMQLTEPPAPPEEDLLQGVGFPPDGLTEAEQFDWFRQAYGLPVVFNRLCYRESRCTQREDIRTSCCYGWIQLHVYLHLRDHRLAPRYAACGVDDHRDIDGPEIWEKRAHVCAARAVLDVQGMSAWAIH